jgi:DNA-directed RNA polymerase I subunit RPA2
VHILGPQCPVSHYSGSISEAHHSYRLRMATDTNWSHEFETLRRENLFRNPPKDHTAYPALVAAVLPHIDSFNALLEKDGLIAQALRDIGTKTYLDGDERAPPAVKNKLSISIKEVFLEKSQLPASNKFSTKNREILPAECRERHVSYRGKMSARLEYRINNGDPKEFIRELGQLPIMLKVRITGLGTSRY